MFHIAFDCFSDWVYAAKWDWEFLPEVLGFCLFVVFFSRGIDVKGAVNLLFMEMQMLKRRLKERQWEDRIDLQWWVCWLFIGLSAYSLFVPPCSPLPYTLRHKFSYFHLLLGTCWGLHLYHLQSPILPMLWVDLGKQPLTLGGMGERIWRVKVKKFMGWDKESLIGKAEYRIHSLLPMSIGV